MTLDLRLLPLAVAVWLGCVFGLHTGRGFVLVGVVAIAVAIVLPRTRVIMAALLVGTVIAGLRVMAADPMVLQELVQRSGVAEVVAVINTEPVPMERPGFGGLEMETIWWANATLVTFRADGRELRTSVPVTLQWSQDSSDVAVGATVRAAAIVQSDDVARRSAYRVRVRGPLVIERPTSRGSELFAGIRRSLGDAIGSHSADARAGATLLPGLVLGDTSAQSQQLVDDLRISGLSHLTAVSGANVAIVLGAVMWLLQRTRLRRNARFAVLAVVLVGFVAVVQPQPSVMRAAVMGAITVFALATGATKQSSSALWLSVVVLLILDPFMAWQYGFGLSVAATAGLIVLQPMMAERLPRHRLLGALLVTIAAQIATLPLLLVMGQPPTWLSIPANVLAEPLVAPATVSGFIATVFAAVGALSIPMVSTVAVWLARTVAMPGVVLGEVIVRIARTGANSPLAVSPFASVRSSLLFVVALLLFWRLRRQRLLVVGVAIAYLLASCTTVTHRWPPGDWWYVMCDVGQGDASVVRTANGRIAVIDAGPDPRLMRRCLRQLGIRRVDLLVLTHFHADHVEGVSGIVGTADIGAVFIGPSHEPGFEYQRTMDVVRMPVRTIRRGDRFALDGTAFDVLWPTELSGDPNTDSLVIRLRNAHGTVLLAADADRAAQARFTAPVVDILKVPHHGSKYQDEPFLRRTHARLSLVSVGVRNDYGHPATGTLQLLRSMGSRVLRTDEVGAIAIVDRDGTLAFVTER